MTHDSIGLGEDGPTHQPVEVLPLLRATPNLLVLRPADGNETNGAYLAALKNTSGPSVICLSRQKLPQLENSSPEEVLKGAYIVHHEDSSLKAILISTGSEVTICIEAAKRHSGIRVVSIPSWELFERQSSEYKSRILPRQITTFSVEASSTLGWSRYADHSFGIDQFGKSGPYDQVYESFGLTSQNVLEEVVKAL